MLSYLIFLIYNYLNTNYLQEHYEELESSFYVALIELAKIKKVRII